MHRWLGLLLGKHDPIWKDVLWSSKCGKAARILEVKCSCKYTPSGPQVGTLLLLKLFGYMLLLLGVGHLSRALDLNGFGCLYGMRPIQMSLPMALI